MHPTVAPVLFALAGTEGFAEQVAQQLGMALSPHEERVFEDTEHKLRPLVNVRGRAVYVVHSLHADARFSADDKLCRLLFFIGTLKDAAAASVTAVVPYLAYARKDRKTQPRDPVTSRYVAALFEAVGTDVVITLDVHNLAAYQNAFRCRTEHLEANALFVETLAPILANDDVLVLSPDAGGIKRAEHFRRMLSEKLKRPVDAGFAEKYRSGGVLTGERIVGDVAGKTVLMLDDLISSGGTLARAAAACRSLGARRILAAATHGLFNVQAIKTLTESPIERVFVTDSAASPALAGRDTGSDARIVVVSCAPLFARAIRALHEEGSITALANA